MCFRGKSKTRKCSICKHFVAQITHQIDKQSHNIGILHELCMSMDVWVWEKRVNPLNFKFCLQTLWSSWLHIKLIHSQITVVFCMTKAFQLMGEQGSEPLGIQSRHEPISSKRRPSPHLASMRWTSRGDPKFCVAYYFNFVNCKFQYSYDVYLSWFRPQIFANLHNSIVGHVVVTYYIA